MALGQAFTSGVQTGSQAVARGQQTGLMRQQENRAKQKQMLEAFGSTLKDSVTSASQIVENANTRRAAGEDVNMEAVAQAVDQLKNSTARSAQMLSQAGLPVNPESVIQQFEAIKTQPTVQQEQQVKAQGEGQVAAEKAEQTGETETWYDPQTDSFREVRTTDQQGIDQAINKGMFKLPAELQTAGTGELTKSGMNKIKVDQMEAETAVKQNVANIQPIVDMIASDEFVGGTSGQVVQGVNSAVAQYRQLTGQDSVIGPGGEIDESEIEMSEETTNRFRRAAQTGDRIDSAILELAFLRAKSLNPDGKISDADVRAAEKILGTGADKSVRIQLLRDLQERMVRNYNIAQRVRAKALGQEFTPIKLEDIQGGEDRPTTGEDAARKILQDEGLF